MNKLFATAALAGLVAATATSASAADKVKCFGIAEKGKNACASADGSHSCAGQAKADNLPTEWVYASSDECSDKGGSAGEPKKM